MREASSTSSSPSKGIFALAPILALAPDTSDHVNPVEDRADAGIKSIAKQGGEGPNWRSK